MLSSPKHFRQPVPPVPNRGRGKREPIEVWLIKQNIGITRRVLKAEGRPMPGWGRFPAQGALALLAALHRDQAEIILLHVAAGLDTRDVACVVREPPDAVRVTAHGALHELAAAVKRTGVTGMTWPGVSSQ